MPRFSIPCQFCGETVYRDYHRNRVLDNDGAAHRCPVPELPNIIECVCGVIVSVRPDGLKFSFRDGTAHDHAGTVVTKQTDGEQGATTVWEAYSA